MEKENGKIGRPVQRNNGGLSASEKDKLKLRWLEGREDISACHQIRGTVFMDEQGYSYDADESDRDALHLLISYKNTAIATGRILTDEGFHIGRVAVLKEWRGKQVGYLLMKTLVNRCFEIGAQRIEIGAQAYAESFYRKVGFLPFGEPYMDGHVVHIHMQADKDSCQAAMQDKGT